ncbi:MAG TPA: hypothetical protein VFD82_19870, partial [Planctomycetota bacterium]|nr:hypothetical protein [Planctomycetota bacterium]
FKSRLRHQSCSRPAIGLPPGPITVLKNRPRCCDDAIAASKPKPKMSLRILRGIAIDLNEVW